MGLLCRCGPLKDTADLRPKGNRGQASGGAHHLPNKASVIKGFSRKRKPTPTLSLSLTLHIVFFFADLAVCSSFPIYVALSFFRTFVLSFGRSFLLSFRPSFLLSFSLSLGWPEWTPHPESAFEQLALSSKERRPCHVPYALCAPCVPLPHVHFLAFRFIMLRLGRFRTKSRPHSRYASHRRRWPCNRSIIPASLQCRCR